MLLKDALRKDGIKTRISPAPRSIQGEFC
ncbi:MAG: DUF3343 domain-containing protein [Dorea sp.]|nr:DUF3343 domain-containing protein [Dorea sp.]